MNDDYYLDADRLHAYESYSATVFHLSDGEHEPSSLPFGFVNAGQDVDVLTPLERWERWHK